LASTNKKADILYPALNIAKISLKIKPTLGDSDRSGDCRLIIRPWMPQSTFEAFRATIKNGTCFYFPLFYLSPTWL